MEQFKITSSYKFEESLKKFKLDREKVRQNILKHIESKLDDLSTNKRRVFQSPYQENDKKYTLSGFVTKHENSCTIEAVSIWDKELNIDDIKVKVLDIGIIK